MRPERDKTNEDHSRACWKLGDNDALSNSLYDPTSSSQERRWSNVSKMRQCDFQISTCTQRRSSSLGSVILSEGRTVMSTSLSEYVNLSVNSKTTTMMADFVLPK